MAKSKPTKEVAVVENKALSNSLEILSSLKAEISSQAMNCMQIKVVDESTLAICQQNLSKINQLVKTVDAKRKELKDPFFQAGKQIDATANELLAVAEAAVEYLKNEVKTWEITKQKELEAAKAEMEAKAQAAAKEAMEDENRKYKIRQNIDKARAVLQNYLDGCVSVAFCDKAISDINTGYRPREEFMEFADEAYELRDNYLQLIATKKEQLEKASSLSENEKAILAEKERLAKLKLELAAQEAELKAKEEAIAAEKARKEEEERLALEKAKLDAEAEANATRGLRELWKYELVDKEKLSIDWRALDSAAVKEWMKENKDKIKDGEIINGVKFFKEISVVA